MNTLFLGSIGTLAETSALQLEAFNSAFAQTGLDWHWSVDDYREMLVSAGGADRIAAYAQSQKASVDAIAVHALKSELYKELLQSRPIELRPGVANAIAHVKSLGGKLALVTSTSHENVATLLSVLKIPESTFDVIVHKHLIEVGKPDPEAYFYALKALRLTADSVVSVEDNPDGAKAAVLSGTRCIATPGSFHDAANFGNVAEFQTTLDVTRYI
ncbi:MAG: HAD-IA family hydrolase [Epibacterium sp.]|nr:HAD-IA family hydrolase [Epibacterium sp.]NQX74611.1 HAD-IA family hydrolase [Epibacterium sp.]